MPERLTLVGALIAGGYVIYKFLAKLVDKWAGKKANDLEALQHLLTMTNGGKDIIDHLEDSKIKRLTEERESADLKKIIEVFPSLINRMDALTHTLQQLQDNWLQEKKEQREKEAKQGQQDAVINKMTEAFNHMADKFDDLKHGK